MPPRLASNRGADEPRTLDLTDGELGVLAGAEGEPVLLDLLNGFFSSSNEIQQDIRLKNSDYKYYLGHELSCS